MEGEIPTILACVSQLLESNNDAKSIWEHGLAKVENTPKVDLLKEKRQWWIIYANQVAKYNSNAEGEDAGELIVVSISIIIIDKAFSEFWPVWR